MLCAPPPPFELTYEDRDLLKTVGPQRRRAARAAARRRQLAESRQFDAYNRFDGLHDARPQEFGRAAAVAGRQRRAAPAQPGVHRRRDRHDRNTVGAHDAADRAVAAAATTQGTARKWISAPSWPRPWRAASRASRAIAVDGQLDGVRCAPIPSGSRRSRTRDPQRAGGHRADAAIVTVRAAQPAARMRNSP